MIDPRAVLYFRDSGGNNQDMSVGQQEQALRKYCAEAGYEVVRTFADVARSGGSVAGRDSFLKMVEYLENGGEKTVFVWDFSRFTRDYDDGQYYLSHLRRLGVNVISLKEQIPDGPIGRVVESMHLFAAAQYRAQMSTNIKRGLRYMATVYKSWPSGAAPAGYQLEYIEIGKRRDGSAHYARRLVIDPAKAPVVRIAFDLRAQGYSIPEIHAATGLYQWAALYYSMLKTLVYTGTLDYKGLLVPDFCEALITPDIWEAVQARRTIGARRETSSYLLSGLVVCAKCGHRMGGGTAMRKLVGGGYRAHRYYFCMRNSQKFGGCQYARIKEADLDDAVMRTLGSVLTSPGLLRQIQADLRASYDAHDTTTAARSETLSAEIATIERKRRRLLAALEDSDAPPRTVLERINELEQEQQRKREELSTLQTARPAIPPPAEDVEALGAEVWAALQAARVSDPRRLQLLLRSMVQEVRAARDGAGIVGDILLYSIPGLGIVERRLSLI